MKIIETLTISSTHVTFNKGYPSEYTRYGPDNWVAHYGMSGECVSDPEELEKAYQNFLVDSAS
jgi:hypothetical protein